MSRISQVTIFIALFVSLAAGAVTLNTGSATDTAFESKPVKVLDQTNTTDTAKWSAIPYNQVALGSGTSNATSYLYAWVVASNAITTVISRSINNTAIVANPTDTSEAAVGADVSATVSWSYKASTSPVGAAGGGSLALAYQQDDTATVACTQLYLSIIAGGATSASATKVALTASTCATASGTSATSVTDGKSYAYTISRVWYQDSAFYVAYVTATTTTPGASTSVSTPAAASTADSVSVQGVFLNGTAVFKSPVAVTSALTGTSGSTIVAAGPSNGSNASSIWVAYTQGGNTGTTLLYTVKVADGTVGSSVTVGTNVNSAVSSSADGVQTTLTPIGFLSGSVSGVLLSNTTIVTPKGTSTPNAATYGLGLYNVTGSAASTSGIAASSATGAFTTATGWAYNSTAYAITAAYQSAAAATPQPAGYTFVYGVFNTSGGSLVAQKTYASINGGTVSTFADVNQTAVWAGYVTYDVTTSASPANIIQAAYLGKLAGTSVTTTSAGSIISTFTLLLSAVAALLFFFA